MGGWDGALTVRKGESREGRERERDGAGRRRSEGGGGALWNGRIIEL